MTIFFFFLLFLRFRKFFPPIFGNVIATIAKKKFYTPISTMALPQFVCQNFFFFSFSLRALYARAAELGRGNSISPLPKFNIFSLHLFSSSLSYFWFNFGNGNTEIQSLSSKSQITLNSTYNAN